MTRGHGRCWFAAGLCTLALTLTSGCAAYQQYQAQQRQQAQQAYAQNARAASLASSPEGSDTQFYADLATIMAKAPHQETAAEEAALSDLLAGGAPTADEQRTLDGFLSGPQQHACARLAAQTRWEREQNAQAWQTQQLQAAARAQRRLRRRVKRSLSSLCSHGRHASQGSGAGLFAPTNRLQSLTN